MAISREMSTKTWNEIDNVVRRISDRAYKAKDWDTVKDADRINALLRNLANEIQMEDDQANAPTTG